MQGERAGHAHRVALPRRIACPPSSTWRTASSATTGQVLGDQARHIDHHDRIGFGRQAPAAVGDVVLVVAAEQRGQVVGHLAGPGGRAQHGG